MIRYSYGLNQLLRSSNIEIKELPKNAIYEKGKTYWCGYWQKGTKYFMLSMTIHTVGLCSSRLR